MNLKALLIIMIKYYFLLVLILLFCVFCVDINGQTAIKPSEYSINEEYREDIFFDDFLTNENNWTLVIDENSFRKIENSNLICWSYFTNDPKYWRSAFSLKTIKLDESKNYEIEASISCSQFGKSPIPLIWGRDTKTLNTLYYGFTNDGGLNLLKFENDRFYNLFFKAKCVDVSAYNKLTVRKFNGVFYFFLNETLVYKMPSFKLLGNEFGFQAPTNSIVNAAFFKISYIGEVNYEKLVKAIVIQKYNQWAARGKYEKTVDYQSRIDQHQKSKTIAVITQEVIDSIGNSKSKFELLRNEYNPDNEEFKLYFKAHSPITVRVPIKEAQSFDDNFYNLILKPRFTLKNNEFPLVYMEILNTKNNKRYEYRNNIDAFEVKKLFPYIETVDTLIIPKEIIVEEIAKQQVDFQKQLADLTQKMIEIKNITDQVKTNVTAKVVEEKDSVGNPELNYQITYSYEVIKALFESDNDDFPSGKYRVSTSNAAKITLEVLKENVENKLYKFLTPGTKVTIKIKGSADSSPIKGAIKYDGEYGTFMDENCYMNNKLSSVTLNSKDGISTNEQLAFLRTYSVRQFIETYVDAFRPTENVFQHYCEVANAEGGQYRRISIELTIHKAFAGKKASELFAQSQIKPEQKSDVDMDIPETNVKNDSYFALIVGNEDYKNEIKVPFALHDADVFKQYCIKTFGIPESQIHHLANASYGELQGEIKWLADVINAFKGQANIIIYYAGHGMPDEGTKNAYILPVDGNSAIPTTALSLEDFYKKLQVNPTKSITVFLDACFSGASRDGMLTKGRGVAIKSNPQLLNNNMVVFSATSNEETALPYTDRYHGIFTYYLLRKIKDSKGVVTYEELFDYTKLNVAQQSIIINQKVQIPAVNVSADMLESWKIIQINK